MSKLKNSREGNFILISITEIMAWKENFTFWLEYEQQIWFFDHFHIFDISFVMAGNYNDYNFV
jgi:hypothetical protein